MFRRVVGAALIALMGLSSCATVRGWFSGTAAPPPVPPAPDASVPMGDFAAPHAAAPIWIEGPLLRATSVAVGYFVANYSLLHDEQHPQLESWYRCMSRVDTYDAQVLSDEPERWFLYVVPKQERCHDLDQGHLVTGGTTFEISKQDFRILSARNWEG